MARTRAAVLAAVAGRSEPVGAADLGVELGLHPNAVRRHLAALVDDGLLVQQAEHRGGRGRPRLVWRAIPPTPSPHERLAVLLAEVLATGRSPEEVGRAHGFASGADLVSAMAEAGFDPVVDGDDVVLRACPYAEAATVNAAAVCGIHLGLARGAADATGGAAVASLSVASPATAGCRIHLRRAPVESA